MPGVILKTENQKIKVMATSKRNLDTLISEPSNEKVIDSTMDDQIPMTIPSPAMTPNAPTPNLPPVPPAGQTLVDESFAPPKEKIVLPEEVLGAMPIVRSGTVENFYGANLVRVRRIPPFKFRLGLEKQPEQYNAMPGAIYRWEPTRVGDQYLTGLEDKPELRAALEKATRYNLAPDSEFYQNLSYKLEDKPKGKLMNLTDPQMGYFNQIVLFAMVASPLVAGTLDDYNNGTKPHAAWYVENKEAESLRKIDAISKEQEAYDTYKAMPNTKKVRVAKVLGVEIYGLSDAAAGAELWDYIKTNSDNAKAFLEVAGKPEEYILAAALLNEAIRYNIVRRNSNRELEFRRQPIGGSESQAIGFLMHHANRMTYLEIDKEIKIKLGIS